MNIEHLVKMVNQIERFFRGEPDRETAIAGIAGHLQRYWEPRMRREIVAHLKAGGGDLGELAREAVQRISI